MIDQTIQLSEDSRNVIDAYKNWPNHAISDDLQKKAFDFHIAIENYQHDFNIGTIVRNANAFGCAGVHIIGKRKWNRRGAMCTEKYLQLYHHENVAIFKDWAIGQNLEITGIDNIKNSVELHSIKIPKKVVLVFGQEGPGLSKDMQKICKNIIAIEQFGSTRSVNVGVASGIVMYEWIKTWAFK